MIKTKNLSRKSKTIMAILVIVLIVLATFLVREHKKNEVATVPGQEAPVNLNPPSEEDAVRAGDNKQSIIDQQEKEKTQTSPVEGTKKTVKPVITYAGQYGQSVEVAAEVSVFEDGGVCTTVYTREATVITKTAAAVKNVNRVNCPPIPIPSSEFNPKGDWSVTISYNSDTTSGVSAASIVGVK